MGERAKNEFRMEQQMLREQYEQQEKLNKTTSRGPSRERNVIGTSNTNGSVPLGRNEEIGGSNTLGEEYMNKENRDIQTTEEADERAKKEVDKLAKKEERKRMETEFREQQAKLKEQYEHQEWLRMQQRSRERSSSKLPRGISPETNQDELRQRYQQQQNMLKQQQNDLKETKQKQASELQKENVIRQTQLREQFEEQEWLKKKASIEAQKERERSLSAQRLPRGISPDASQN